MKEAQPTRSGGKWREVPCEVANLRSEVASLRAELVQVKHALDETIIKLSSEIHVRKASESREKSVREALVPCDVSDCQCVCHAGSRPSAPRCKTCNDTGLQRDVVAEGGSWPCPDCRPSAPTPSHEHKFECDTDEQQCMEEREHWRVHRCRTCAKTREELDLTAPAPSGEPQTVIRCEKCGEAFIYKRTDEGYSVFAHKHHSAESSPVDLQDAAKLKAQEEILREMAELLRNVYGDSRHCTANEARQELIRRADKIAAHLREGR